MKARTFRHGIHPADGKSLSASSPIRLFVPTGAGEAVYPLSQHIGTPAVPVVSVGDRVRAGQKLAEAGGFVSAPIYSAFSGTVRALEPRAAAGGETVPCIVLETDAETEWIDPRFDPATSDVFNASSVAAYMASGAPEHLTAEDIRAAVREAGVVGLGGAGFPTAVKLTPKNPDHRLMLERGEALVAGCRLLLRLFPGAVCVLAVENNKPDAIAHLSDLVRACGDARLSVCPLKTKYPQGGERMLIRAVTGRYLNSRLLPADRGCIVMNVASVLAAYGAISCGRPLTHCIMTVTGDAVSSPCNLEVPVGTSYAAVLAEAGGFSAEPEKVISGGPMMGTALFSLDIPVTKTASSILALRHDPVALHDASPCIHCGHCLHACPEKLVPQLLSAAAEQEQFDVFEKYGGMECIECGSCAFVCPAGRHLVQSMRYGKRQTGALIRARKAAETSNQTAQKGGAGK